MLRSDKNKTFPIQLLLFFFIVACTKTCTITGTDDFRAYCAPAKELRAPTESKLTVK